MFSINPVFSSFYGNPGYTGKINGADVMIMESAANLDKVLPDFEEAIRAGLNPNDVKDEIFSRYNISDADFTQMDARKLQRRVEEIYTQYNR